MQDTPHMIITPTEKQPVDGKTEFSVLNNAIASFNTTAQELEQSYRLLHDQVKLLNMELEEKNQQLQRNLQEKERVKNFLSSILESLPTGVVVTDLHDGLLMCNSAVEKITGTDPASLDSMHFAEWLKNIQCPAQDRLNPDKVNSHDSEYSKSKNDVRSLKVFQAPAVGTNGETIGRLLIIQDQTRLKKLEMQTERDNRLKAMGEMAIRIAHEVRNPLGSIELFASILRKELNMQRDLHKMAERIITEVKSLDNSISNLLLFTRPQKPVLHKCEFTEFITEFIEFIKPIVSKNGVELICDVTTEQSHLILADRDLLKQVFLNLTLNSLQALPKGGCIHLGIRPYTDENESCSKWLEITFSDNGVGIAPDQVNKIFHPFYTTKEKGTGLGLAIVHNIVESHAGILEVRSRVGDGTTFFISLPVADAGSDQQ